MAALPAAEGADLIGYDPGVPAAVPGMTDDLQLTDDPLKVASGAAALVVLTEWPEFPPARLGSTDRTGRAAS